MTAIPADLLKAVAQSLTDCHLFECIGHTDIGPVYAPVKGEAAKVIARKLLESVRAK